MYAYSRVTRGGITESLHRARLAVRDSTGRTILEAGDASIVTFLRSSWKPIQALGLFTTGAALAYAIEPHEIAVCCASHHGQDIHLAAVRSVLAKAGVAESALRCGAHWPADAATCRQLRDAGLEPSDIHNNCSGKHAGMLVRCAHLGLPLEDYLDPDHPVQRMMLAEAAELGAASPEQFVLGTDGCTTPTWGLPLANSALAWARLGAADTGDDALRDACRSVTAAMAANPRYVGGDASADTRIMQVTKGRVVTKGGAEAAAAACVPTEGIGIVVKVEDGNARGTTPLVIEVLRYLGLLSSEELEELAPLRCPPVLNCNRIECGRVIPVLSECPPEDAFERASVRS